jgi:hypothetical protein
MFIELSRILSLPNRKISTLSAVWVVTKGDLIAKMAEF